MAKAPDGLDYTCKVCRSAYGIANRRRLTENQAVWRRNNPERFRANQLSSARSNPGAARRRWARYYAKNRESILAKRRDAYARDGIYRARRVSQMNDRLVKPETGQVTADDWREILSVFDYRCAYCLARGGALAMDHVVALSRGGKHEPSNVAPACKSCNSSKGAKPLAQWLDLPLLRDRDATEQNHSTTLLS